MAKLKAALANQQYSAAKAAAKKRSLQNEESKKQSIKDSLSGSRKGLKKQKQKLREKQQLAGDSASSISGMNTEGAVDEKHGESSTSNKKPNPNRKAVIPFTKEDTILLLGEGNFSFTLSLLYSPHNLVGSQITSTAYDSEEITYKKYPDSVEIIKELQLKGVDVRFEVDAGSLEKTFSIKGHGRGKKHISHGGAAAGESSSSRRWSRVIFNFPHVGAGITDQDRNILTNQHMLLRFFQSVEPYLTDGPADTIQTSKKGKGKGKLRGSDDEDDIDDLDDEEVEEESPYITEEGDSSFILPSPNSELKVTPKEPKIPNKQGSILITLLSCPPYSLWSLPKLATKPPHFTPGTLDRVIQPRYTLKRSFEFNPDLYERYEHRRTIGWKDGLSKGKNHEILNRKGGGARTWEFVRKVKKDED